MEGGELDANDKLVCKRALLQHKASLSLAAAGAAVEQGVLILGNEHLKAAGSATRKLEQLDTSSSGSGGGRSFELAARLLQYNRAYATRLTDEGSSSSSSDDSSAARLKQQAMGIADKSLKFIQVHLGSAAITATTAATTAATAAAVKRAELLAQRGWWLQYKAVAIASRDGSSDDAAQRHKLLQDAYTALSDGAATAVVSTAAAAVATAAAGSATTAAHNSTRGDCHLQLAKLCDALAAELSAANSTSSSTSRTTADSSQQSPAALAALAIEHYLQAAGAGGTTSSSATGSSASSSSSSGAVDYIPRALHLLGKGGNAARAAFASAAATTPEWVFLR
jgi:trimeric autotransporter adhesin